MTYVPHYRISMLGKLGNGGVGPEIFSCNISLGRTDQAPVGAALDPNATIWTDIANDCAAWFGRATSYISSHARLTMVKVAPIGANGLYTGVPAERVKDTPGAFTAAPPPFQTAYAVTLKTAGDLNRVKGRFYAPIPIFTVGVDGMISVAGAEDAEASAATLINAINNQPGIDVLGLNTVVASQGRRNPDGSLRVQPANHLVTGVSVGRTLDTIRRRRNKLREFHTYTPVS